MKKGILAGIIIAIVLAVGIGGYFIYNSIYYKDSLVTIDINPSVQFVVNKNDKVANVIALPSYDAEGNEKEVPDAEIVLSNLDLVGLDVAVATEQFLAEAAALGFIDVDAAESDPNAVLITSLCDGDAAQNRLQNRLQKTVEGYMQNNGIWGICFTPEDMNEIITEAQTLGVSTGKLRMIKAILVADSTKTQEELLDLSNRELVNIMKLVGDKDYKDQKETESEALRDANANKIEAHNQTKQQKANQIRDGWDDFKDNQKSETGNTTKNRLANRFGE